MAEICPIKALSAILDQPPSFLHSVNTALADWCGAMAHSTITTTVQERICRIMSRLLNSGIMSAA